jgi:signal transduction histidine kinase
MNQNELYADSSRLICNLEREKEQLLLAISQFYHDASQPLTSLGIWIELAKVGADEPDDLAMAYDAFKQLREMIMQLRRLHSNLKPTLLIEGPTIKRRAG